MSADAEQQVPEISKETFMRLDSNGDGYISKNEFKNSLKKEGCFEKEDAVDAAWSHFDKNTDGRICFGGKKFRKISGKLKESRLSSQNCQRSQNSQTSPKCQKSLNCQTSQNCQTGQNCQMNESKLPKKYNESNESKLSKQSKEYKSKLSRVRVKTVKR